MAKITIIGGGNIGMVLSAKFSQSNDVTLYVGDSKAIDEYMSGFVSINDQNLTKTYSKLKLITNNLQEAIDGAGWIFITYPAFLFESLSKKLIPILSCGQHLVGVPGSGGFELFFKKALEKGCIISGLQRVHSVARIEKKGKIVHESGIRQSLKCATIPLSHGEETCKFLSSCYNLPVENIGCYLNVTLINSNPILHTSRLYSIFSDYFDGKKYKKLPLFYEEWDVKSSILLEQMDNELFEMLSFFETNGLPVNKIKPLLFHYESCNATEMTNKINSIDSLKGLKTPSNFVCENGINYYVPDLSSRYFSADFPYGLDILVEFANIVGIKCPKMNMVSNWYHKISKTKQVFCLKEFGLSNIKDIKRFYSLS